MQMAEQFDISTLAWVKGEIDETLKQARIALEAFVEDPNDEAQLQFCITYIHQVYGTLHMVELAGAAMFAEEVEAFATAIQQGAIENKELAYELLMRAILQLPDYLEGLMAGQNDNPAGLVPLLNELRQLRGEKPLDSSDFFRPDLAIAPPPRKERPAAGIDSTVAAKKLHRYYLAALAKILKGVDVDANFKALATVLEKLYAIGERDNWRRLLWISSALIEGMREGAIELTRETKPLLGKIEQAIKSVAVKGEVGLSEEVLNRLYPQMLYRIALSNAQGNNASAVREAFRLEQYLPQGSGLGGVTAELKQTVSADIMEELSRVKDTFDVFVRSDRKKITDLEQMANSLVSIADTLNVLQEEKLQQSLQSQTAVIRQLLAGEAEPSDDTLMGIAGAILAVESALRDWGNTNLVVEADAREEQVADTENAPEAAAEHQRVTRQVMKESRDDLIKIREAINTYLDKPQEKHILEGLPSMLHMIIGSLNLLSYKRVAQVLASCSVFIERELINSAILPADEKLDALADAVMSVEYYLEAFVQSRVHPTSVLEVAENAVTRLGYPVGTVEDSADSEVVAPELEGIDVFESADAVAEKAAEEIAVEKLPAEEISEAKVAEEEPVIEEPVIEEPAANELPSFSLAESEFVEPAASEATPSIPEPEVELSEEPVVTQSAEIPAPAPAATRQAPSVEIDDEILEIFIEEAEEELNNIRTLLPKWKESTGDDEALKDLRRSFHTLKGSGRLVGAADLGEFAWAFENMLNRIIDGTIGPNATIFDMLDQGVQCLPELILQFKEGTTPQCDAEMLREMAFEVVQPGGLSMPEPVKKEVAKPVAEAVAEHPPQQEAPLGEVPELDPVLLEIYSKEAEGHLDELDAFVANYQAGGSHKASEPLIRALHTLQGSSRMAGVVSVADICAKLEKYSKTLQATGELVNDDGIRAIQACTEYTRSMLAFLLDRTGRTLPDSQRAQQLADGVFAAVQHMEDAAHARPEAGLAYKEEIEVSESEPQIEPEVSQPSAEQPALGGFTNKASEPERESGATPSDSQQPLSTEVQGTKAEWGASNIGFDAPVFKPEAPTVQPVKNEAQSLALDEEYDPELLEIFLEEGVDILDASEETLQAWVERPDDKSLVQSLQRQLHTLKGGARMAGIQAIGDLSHSLETVFDGVVDGLIERSPEMIDLLQLSHDRLVTMLEQVKKHEPITTGDDLISKVEALAHGGSVEETVTPAPAVPDIKLVKPAEPVTPEFQPEVVETSTIEPVIIEPDTSASGLPEIAPDLSILEQAIADVEFNLTTLVRDVTDRALFENLRKSGLRLAEISREVDIAEVVELTDALVLLLSAINDGHVASSKKSTDLMMLTLDRVRLMLNQVKSLEPIENSDFLAADIKELISSSVAAEEGSGLTDNVAAVEEVPAEPEQEEESDNRRKAPRIQHEVVRVRSDLLDNLVNFAGEVSIYRSRVEQQIGSFRGSIDEMDQTVVRLREQIRQVNIETEAQIASRREEVQKSDEEFDPLEFDRFTHMQQISRSMMESLSDLVSIEDMLVNLTRESETLLLQQSRVNTELQENLMHTRMVPLSEYAPRLRRIVRQTSSELGKRTNLGFEGAEVEMDRNVVERMMAPLEHMLRNSIAHGIEDLDGRRKAGKPEVGTITISLSREGSEIIVRVRDDGAGINLEAVKKKALERGLMKAGAKLSDKEIMGFILESGFSTAQSLSQIAGRGVGMDVVNSEIKQLGGVLEIDTTQGQGTEFLVRLPLTLSVSRALLVYVDEDVYAIPLLSIGGIERIAGSELESLLNQENPTFTWLGEEYDVMHLTNVLGAGSGLVNADLGRVPLLMARSGEHRIAFAIDGLIGSREIVVKSLGPQLSTLQDLAGATILADGSVALIIDMPSLIRRGLARKGGVVTEPEFIEQAEEREVVVMVVDDSITVRKVTERLLKRHSMKCVTAKDGVDALTVLEETIPDVMLLDIEMPRMDGFELATHIRNSDRLKDIPIIMITSRTGEKHRQRAMDIGVNKYMGKPYTEVDLLENIESLVGKQG